LASCCTAMSSAGVLKSTFPLASFNATVEEQTPNNRDVPIAVDNGRSGQIFTPVVL
jgi:hypothetical protein